MANEQDNADKFIEDVLNVCSGYNFKSIKFIIIIDDASSDNTFDILQEKSNQIKSLIIVYAPENDCVVDAYLRGYREAINRECDWILEIDAGYSHQPLDIPKFFNKMCEGYDCIFGSRFCKGGRYDGPIYRFIISRFGSIITNNILKTKLKDMTSGFEIFTKGSLIKILDAGLQSKGSFFQTEIKYIAHYMNMSFDEVPISYQNPSIKNNGSDILEGFQMLYRLFIINRDLNV